jgi:hypothetical protein
MPWKQSRSQSVVPSAPTQTDFFEAKTSGEPLLLDIALLEEDACNPRTEFPEAELDELAEDILVRWGERLFYPRNRMVK